MNYNPNPYIALLQLENRQTQYERRIREASFPRLPTDRDTRRVRDMVSENPKRRMLLQTKYTEVERQNRILLQKITTIMTKRGEEGSRRKSNSLNYVTRKKEVQKITMENNKIYNRIRNQKSSYCAVDLEREFSRTRNLPRPQRLSRAASIVRRRRQLLERESAGYDQQYF